MEYEKCYIYEQDEQRPPKRRRTEHRGLHASWSVRHEAYQRAWLRQRDMLLSALNKLNATTVAELSSFLEKTLDVGTSSRNRIPTGFISTGPNTSLRTTLITALLPDGSEGARRASASISADAATNLKAVLKTIIRMTTAQNEGIDDDEDEPAPIISGKGAKLLNFDLQILANYVRDRQLEQVVVIFRDTEAFDEHLLSDLIELFGCWRDRIPFVLLFGIATSVDLLQQRLSKKATKCLDGCLFDVAPSVEEVERVFDSVTDRDSLLYLGPNLMGMILQRHGDYIGGIDGFIDAVQYAYMTSYYANALTIFLDTSIPFRDIPADHFEAVRTLPSFQIFCTQLLNDKQLTRLRHLLESDEILFGLIRSEITSGRHALADLKAALDLIYNVQTFLTPSQATPLSTLYVQALNNILHATSTNIRSMLLTIRKSPSNIISVLLSSLTCRPAIPDTVHNRLTAIKTELSTLIDSNTSSKPFHSSEDTNKSTLRTTVVAQKVALAKQSSAVSEQDAAYTALLRRLTDELETYFATTLLDPSSLVFHEIFLYDLKSPHREVFTPRPRHALERALAAPHDYLDCTCCAPVTVTNGVDAADGDAVGDDQTEATLASTQPPTAILYQLYLESGTLINVRDLWEAFKAVIGKHGKSDEDGEEEEEGYHMALFQRGMAELKTLGLLRATRRRVDHVAKVAWRGL